ncbi:MAG: flagellar protein FlaR [Planctomycetota bacterium]
MRSPSNPNPAEPKRSLDATDFPQGRRRIAVIGNGGGGKTTLALAIADATKLPYHEVDRIQYRAGWEVVDPTEVTDQLGTIMARDAWIIDGFGPWPTIERRARLADTLIFVDHPLWVHCWWAAERQIAASHGQARLGGPDNCPLTHHTREMFQAIVHVHEQIRPRLLELIEEVRDATEIVEIRSPEELDAWHERLANEMD